MKFTVEFYCCEFQIRIKLLMKQLNKATLRCTRTQESKKALRCEQLTNKTKMKQKTKQEERKRIHKQEND